MPVCALCGSEKSGRLHRPVSFHVQLSQELEFRQCSTCELIYLHPRPAQVKMVEHYTDGCLGYAEGSPLRTRLRNIVLRRGARRIRALLPENGRVLDVGCGTAELLSALREEGVADVQGADPSPYAVRQAREQFGLSVAEGTLFDVAGPPGQFSTVVMNHVLQHLPSPREAAERLAELLAPGGVLFVNTPNAASLERRLFGSAWYDWHVPHHPYVYGPGTARRLLAGAGLGVESITYSWLPSNLGGSLANLFSRRMASSRAARVLSVRNPVLLGVTLRFSALLGLLGVSGRMEVVARKTC